MSLSGITALRITPTAHFIPLQISSSVRLISIDLSLLRTDRRHWSRHGRRSTRQGGLKLLLKEVEQSRKRFLPDISGFRTLLERSVTQRTAMAPTGHFYLIASACSLA